MPNYTTGKSPSELFLNRDITKRVDFENLRNNEKLIERECGNKVRRNFVTGDKMAVRIYNSHK